MHRAPQLMCNLQWRAAFEQLWISIELKTDLRDCWKARGRSAWRSTAGCRAICVWESVNFIYSPSLCKTAADLTRSSLHDKLLGPQGCCCCHCVPDRQCVMLCIWPNNLRQKRTDPVQTLPTLSLSACSHMPSALSSRLALSCCQTSRTTADK